MRPKERRIAAEQKTLEEAIASLPASRGRARRIMERLRQITDVPEKADVLDVGAASGGLVVALLELGYRARGVEPWDEARANARQLAEHVGLSADVVAGAAERLPLKDSQFDVVLANSVLEHVENLELAIAEVFRVLKPGGVFWFYSASSMCPRQSEIRGVPLFGWYPDALKRRIMFWARDHRPQLVNYTDTPAIHWFTPWKARRLLREAGFARVCDRWDLRKASAGDGFMGFVLKTIAASMLTKCLADVFVPDCAYAATKKRSQTELA